jgi:hypothetical protein
MKRRDLRGSSATTLAMASSVPLPPLPRRDWIRVGFLLGERITMGPSREPLLMTSAPRVTPALGISDVATQRDRGIPPSAPPPKRLRGSGKPRSTRTWTCRSARAPFRSRAGLLDGIRATTHHVPERGPRFIDNGREATSGGLTSWQ